MREIDKIYFVTCNKSKFKEAKEVFEKYGLELQWACLDVDEIQSSSLMKVVIWKGYEVSKYMGNSIFIVEDTGLFVNALNGFPGVYSSYVYKTIGCRGILNLLKDSDDRSAYFHSYGLLYLGNSIFKLFNVRVNGEISYSERGSMGFGFDPIFIPEGSSQTFAEMSTEVKNMFSHRGKLFNMVAKYILSRRLVER